MRIRFALPEEWGDCFIILQTKVQVCFESLYIHCSSLSLSLSPDGQLIVVACSLTTICSAIALGLVLRCWKLLALINLRGELVIAAISVTDLKVCSCFSSNKKQLSVISSVSERGSFLLSRGNWASYAIVCRCWWRQHERQRWATAPWNLEEFHQTGFGWSRGCPFWSFQLLVELAGQQQHHCWLCIVVLADVMVDYFSTLLI